MRLESDLPEHLAMSYAASRRRVLKKIIEIVGAGIAAGTFRTVDARTAALGIIGMLKWIAWWYQGGSEDMQVAGNLAEMAVGTVQSENRDPQPPTVAGIRAKNSP